MAISESYITLQEVVDNAATIIKASDNFDRNLMKQWAMIGEKEIGFHLGAVKNCRIDVVDLSIRKPSDYYNSGLQELGLYTSSGQEIRYTYRGAGKKVLPKREIRDYTVEITEDKFYWHLDSLGRGAAYAAVRYYGFPVDEDELPLIPRHHLLALMYFIRYMYSMRNPEELNTSQEESRWLREASRARVKNKMPSKVQLKEIAKDWMNMMSTGVKRYQDY